jgi:hypothetical protein
MRTTQFIGLPHRFQDFMQQNNLKWVCNLGHVTDMFGEEIPLNVYSSEETGKDYRETVQTEIWSSGPMIFTKLVDHQFGFDVVAWTAEEISEMV